MSPEFWSGRCSVLELALRTLHWHPCGLSSRLTRIGPGYCEEEELHLADDPNNLSARWPEDFSGVVRLFPLPNLVLFPQVVQPLHVFEPRYCEMLQDAMASDQLIAMALLQQGWEKQYQRCPPVAANVCIGKIISVTPTEDGRFNILLVGMKRARILKELDNGSSFRQAEVSLLEDYYAPEDTGGREALVERLHELFSHFVPEGLAAQESFKQLMGQNLPLGTLTDTITYALNLPIAIKQQMLAEPNVDIRSRLLIRCLEQQIKVSGPSVTMETDFPPKFSEN